MHVGGRVRLARLLAGQTQQWLGRQVGLTFQQIQKYERGTNRVSCSMLTEFAEAFGRPIAWFFEERTPPGPEIGQEPAIYRQRLTLELTSCFVRIENLRARQRIVALTRAIADSPALSGAKSRA